jgi:hypothetical protein
VKSFSVGVDVVGAGARLVELSPAARPRVLPGSEAIFPAVVFFGVVVPLGDANAPFMRVKKIRGEVSEKGLNAGRRAW